MHLARGNWSSLLFNILYIDMWLDFLIFSLSLELPGDPLFIDVKSSLLILPLYCSLAFTAHHWLLFISHLLLIVHSQKKVSQQSEC
jgi:hypothetical protein